MVRTPQVEALPGFAPMGFDRAKAGKVSVAAAMSGKILPKGKARNSKAPAKAAPLATPESVSSAVNARTGNGLVVTTSNNRTIVITRVDGEVNRLTKLGAPVAALESYLAAQPKPQAKLARGVEGKMTENSRKAVADQRRAPKVPAPAPKAGKNKAPARGAERSYTVGKTEVTAKPESWRHHMLTTIRKYGDTAKAKAAHEKSGKFSANKLDFNWAAAQGYINWAK